MSVKVLVDVLAGDPVKLGDRVATLGFTSADYAIVDMALSLTGAVAVPLQTSAPVAQLHPILLETEPVAILASVDHLADAVELALTAHAPKRLVVFDYHPQVDDHRDAFESAAARLKDLHINVETLDDVIRQGAQRTDAPEIPHGDSEDLRLLIYTSGSTGTPKGAMYTDRLMAKCWSGWFAPDWDTEGKLPAITLSFMPISHVMGRVILYSTLGVGGTAYFAASSDLSTLLDDLALVRPTKLDLVPRIWEMLFQEVQSEVDRRTTDGSRSGHRRNTGNGRAARETPWRTAVLGDDGLRAHFTGTAGLDRGVHRHPPHRGLWLHGGRHRPCRRPGPAPTGDRLQAGGRARSGLLRHRPSASAGRVMGQVNGSDPRLLQATRGDG